MDTILRKKDVTRLRVDAGCRLVVVTGSAINHECISINRSPTGHDDHFYLLKDDDVIIRQGEDNTFSADRVVFDKQRNPSYLRVDMLPYYQNPVVRNAMFGQAITTRNEKNTQLVMNDPMFADIITHKFTPYGDMLADHLFDAPSFILEHVTEKSFDLRVNEIHFRVDFKDNRLKGSEPCPLMTIHNSKLQLEEGDAALFVSRSLRRPLRLTIRSRNADVMKEIEDSIIRRINELGCQVQLSKIKRGKLLLVLPNIDTGASNEKGI